MRDEGRGAGGSRVGAAPHRPSWLFGSFWLGGFECSTHVTPNGRRLDSVAASQHEDQAGEDFALCRAIGLRAVREGARWPMLDRGGVLRLEDVRRLVRLGREAQLTLIWDLMHYGYPVDLDPFSARFVERFAAYSGAVAALVREETEGPGYFTPINEISYYAWSGGEVGYMAPFARGRGRELKRNLVRASIAATNAIWQVDPTATMLNVDPLVRLHAPPERPDLQGDADHFNRHVVPEAFDMLSGRLEPELGGSRAHLGIPAFNYYSYNQWTISTPELPQRFLGPGDPGWLPLSQLLIELQARYGGPLLIGETGAPADQRPGWIALLAREAQRARMLGVDLQGMCWYPIVTTPDWEDTTAFLEGGLFDIVPEPDGRLTRVLARPAAAALREAQALLDPENLPSVPLDAQPPPEPEPPLQLVRPIDHARATADNFSHQTLLAGDSLVIELYSFGAGAWVGAHRHQTSEHVLTVVSGEGRVRVGERWTTLRQGEALLVPAGLYHSIHNDRPELLLVQQVSAPKPWDARFKGPRPPSWRGSSQ